MNFNGSTRNPRNDSGMPRHYGFLLLPGYSLIAFASAIEALRMANWVSGQDLYECTMISPDGAAVTSSCGVETRADASLETMPDFNSLIVCGASPVARTGNESVIRWLRQLQKRGMEIGGIGTGSYLMACAGLLDGYRATIHWWDLGSLRDEFPNINVSSNLFEIDRDRITCGGGSAAMDMMLFLIGQQHGLEIASSISEQFVCERIRPPQHPQRIPLQARIGTSHKKLIEAVSLMEANIDEPLTTDDLAFHVGVSRRHLERLFKKHLQSVPSKYYLQLRLEKARQQLQQTETPIAEVARSCGFATASHFSTTYRNHYGVTPRQERTAGP
ncbi:GlxA family transcriptional regulator [Aestuariirhabdus sp. LZHN29]|uniref:GlxA family transcriptional regulator n=1 Tax=Aestuariirhabdus sp. LZHN29 TaxID=3417462 RepID=UPI003CEE7D07